MCCISGKGLVCKTVAAGDQRCPLRERQVEVSRIRVLQMLLYAEAVTIVVEEDG